jgi:hypothetical protein
LAETTTFFDDEGKSNGFRCIVNCLLLWLLLGCLINVFDVLFVFRFFVHSIVFFAQSWYDEDMPRLPRWSSRDIDSFAKAHPTEGAQAKTLLLRGKLVVSRSALSVFATDFSASINQFRCACRFLKIILRSIFGFLCVSKCALHFFTTTTEFCRHLSSTKNFMNPALTVGDDCCLQYQPRWLWLSQNEKSGLRCRRIRFGRYSLLFSCFENLSFANSTPRNFAQCLSIHVRSFQSIKSNQHVYCYWNACIRFCLGVFGAVYGDDVPNAVLTTLRGPINADHVHDTFLSWWREQQHIKFREAQAAQTSSAAGSLKPSTSTVNAATSQPAPAVAKPAAAAPAPVAASKSH